MPKIPILPQAPGSDDEFAALPPEQADGLRRLEARDNSLGAGLALSEAWLAGLDELQDAADAPDGTPAGFARDFLLRADKARAATLTRLPAAQRADADQALLDLRAELTDRAASAEASGQALRRRLGLRRALDNFSAGVRRDPGAFDSAAGRMTALVDGLGLPAERVTALRGKIADTLGNAAVDGLMAEPSEAAAMLDAGLFDDALSGETKAARLAEARVLADREWLLARERARGELLTLAGEGRAEEDAIAAAEAAGSLTAADAAQVRAADAAARQAAETKRMRIDRVAAADGPLDPDLPEDRAAVDAYWETVAEAHASDDPAQQQAADLTFVKTIGVLPDALARRYRGGLLSSDPTLVVQEAAAIAELERTDPRLISALPPEDVRRATAIDEFAALDLPPERAVELGEQKAATEIEDVAGEDLPPATSVSDDAIVDNDQADTPFVGFDAQEDERVSVFRGPDGAVTVTDEDTGESVDVPPDLAQAIEEAAEKNPEAVQLVAQMLAAVEAREGGADMAALLSDLDASIDRVFPSGAGSSRPTRFLNRRFKETMRRALEDPSGGLSAAGILLRQVDPDSMGEMLAKTAQGLAVLLGAVGGAGLARKLFGHFVQAAVSAALQTGRRGPEFGPGIGDETAASPGDSSPEPEPASPTEDSGQLPPRIARKGQNIAFAEDFPVGSRDPILIEREIVQPFGGRTRLLQGAERAFPGFDRDLRSLADAVGGVRVEARVKEGGERLASKIAELQDEKQREGVEPTGPDDGTELIRDYLAGRLIPDSQEALDKIRSEIERRGFVIVGEPKNFMEEPHPTTGYTAIHYQVRLSNGMTAEIQVQPEPFKKAANAQRDLFERWRGLSKEEI